ncbi:MAG: C39 family peptidase [Chloroflexi bacterium]|nr:C39 family peptidase [Chloroflexota bacterium]
MKSKTRFNKLWLIPLGLALLAGFYYLPPVHSRLAWRVDELRTKIIYYFNPPSEAVFQPSGEAALTIETAIATVRAEYMMTLTPQVTATAMPTTGPTPTPTVTSTPLPGSVILPGVKYVDQHERWNYCGPANLTMALNFWGWPGNRDDVARVVKPGNGNLRESFIDQGKDDKNVMPYELVDFVNEETEFRALLRNGGDENLIKRMLAAGFPVLIEKGYYKDTKTNTDWLGHYLFTTGYDDSRGGFIVQDAYLRDANLKPIGKDMLVDYATYQYGWREFNYLFMVIYPADRENEVQTLLGPWSDEKWASQHALELAEKDIQTLTGNDLFFAWFNRGTSHVALQQYVDAATAYDQAFALYSKWDVEKADRPYRILWYQTGPYFAYFYSARYQDVISLADTTLNETISKPTLEESLLWRGRAYYMSGNTQAAVDDYRAALKVHVNWVPALQALQDLGLQP